MLADRIKRVSGRKGNANGLIEIPLYGHRHRYVVRVDLSGPAPRLAELRVIAADGDSEVDTAAVREVPVRRLALAAARFIRYTEHGIAIAGDTDDPTDLMRPDHPKGGRGNKYADVHYRQVRNLLIQARESGLSPRDHVAKQFTVELPTVDRWIKEAKARGILARDWARATPAPDPAEVEAGLWLDEHGPDAPMPSNLRNRLRRARARARADDNDQ
ncbi:MAG: hypothetical protein SV966_12520 [Actinomycetota bacterium]|nr:hypothetical protein [Actinomycetota bacterium]